MILENEAGKLIVEYSIFSNEAFKIYKYLNQVQFKDFSTLKLFEPILTEIFKAHKQNPNITYINDTKKRLDFKKNNKVLVCYSGGLDSAFQALYLKEQGYEVYLMHLQNANIYTNGQETAVVKEFATKFGFPLFIPKISPSYKSEYKKYWQENSAKNLLIYTIAIDYMLSLGIGNLSSGDDLNLEMQDSACGTNTGDSKEITLATMSAFGVNFIPIDRQFKKADRLNFLAKYNARDYFISCVSPGRLIKAQNERYSTKFNYKTDAWNCYSCRKCCSHILLDKYINNKQIPKELEDRCWDRLAIGADEPFFNKKISLNQRIKNLIEY